MIKSGKISFIVLVVACLFLSHPLSVFAAVAPGTPLWAQSTVTAPAASGFSGISTDSSGNSYAAGSITGTSQFDFGNGVTATGGNAGTNTVVVKYDSAGVAQWAKAAVTAPGVSGFSGISTDSSGNSYAAGSITGTSQFDFGNGATVTGGNAGTNTVIVKYNSAGVAQWAKAAITAPGVSSFSGISIDSAGNSYAAGSIRGTSQFDFGNGATVTGGSTGSSTVIVKYNSAGVAQWAKTVITAPEQSFFVGVSADSSGNIYAVGFLIGAGQYDFGNGATVTGGSAGYATNAVIVSYNSAGVAQWAKAAVTAPNQSVFSGISTDSSGNSYAAGSITGTSQFDFGNGATVTGGNAGTNTVIVKYAGETVTPVIPTSPTSPALTTLPATGADRPISDEKDISWNAIILPGIFAVFASIYIVRKKQRSLA